MMAFQSNYCVAIKHNGKTLREFQSTLGRHTIALPYEAEYEILLINNTDTPATVEVTVGGINVLDSKKLFLNAHDRTTLKGFHRNDSMNRAFKFVRGDDARVDVPDNPNNGNIEVTFWRAKVEKSKVADEHHHHYHHYYEYEYKFPKYPKPDPWRWNDIWIGGCSSLMSKPLTFGSSLSADSAALFSGGGTQSASAPESTVNCNYNSVQSDEPLIRGLHTPDLEKGATVAGSHVNQNFDDIDNVKEIGVPVRFSFTLVGSKSRPVTVKETRNKTCNNCNNTSDKWNAKFCSRCGNSYQDLCPEFVIDY